MVEHKHAIHVEDNDVELIEESHVSPFAGAAASASVKTRSSGRPLPRWIAIPPARHWVHPCFRAGVSESCLRDLSGLTQSTARAEPRS